MGIDRIRRLRGCGIFQDFTWPDELHDMAKFNLVYGWNGTGKTTVSRILRDLEWGKVPPGDNVTLTISGRDVSGSDFPTESAMIRVFNQDFIRDSVFPVGGDVQPIFVLGEESVAKQRKIEELKSDLDKAQATLRAEKITKEAAERALDNHCIAQGGAIKSLLRAQGNNPYNNYNKAHYRSRALSMLSANVQGTYRLDATNRAALQSQHLATPKQKIGELSCEMPDVAKLGCEVSELLASTVTSQVLLSLRDDAELSEWVRDGLQMHRKRDSKDCLYCEQPLPSERLLALENHFNDQHEKLTGLLNAKVKDLDEGLMGLSQLSLPAPSEFYDHLAAEYEVACEEVNRATDAVSSYIVTLKEHLASKKSNMFQAVSISGKAPQIDADVVEVLNLVIRAHNQASDNHQADGHNARKKLEADSAAGTLDEFQKLIAEVKEQTTTVNDILNCTKSLRREISLLESEIAEHRRPAEEMNEDLHQYLGHNELQLGTKDTGYAITRNGIPATSLSEGETTAFALLYFLKSLEDHRFDLANGVVVLDDPVSSLDANALYLAFGLIKAWTRDAGQVLILTHNFAFFRLVRNWFHKLKGQGSRDMKRRPARFFMVACNEREQLRSSEIRPLDKLLEEYESEYHYLFSCLYRAVSCPSSDLEGNYALPNMGRRLLEAFLAFRRPDITGGLWEKLEGIDFDEAKKTKIRRFVDTYSHADAIEEPEHDLSLLSEAGSVLTAILDLMETTDQEHFGAMVSTVRL